MGMKRKASEEAVAEFDWKSHPRRPFRRGFIPYAGSDLDPAEVVSRRQALGIFSVEDPAGSDVTPPPVESFEELGALPPWLLDSLRDHDMHEPTALQAQGLPILLAGQNMVAIGKAGLGQAVACLLSAIVHVDDQPCLSDEDAGPIALVLCPSLAHATVVADEATKLLEHSDRSSKHPGGIRCVLICDGGNRKEQLTKLGTSGSHIVVGTPERIFDMASKDQLSFLRVTYLAIDGADALISSSSMSEKVLAIADWVRPERQTTLYTATWPQPLLELSGKLCYAGGSPVRISVKQPVANKAKAGAAKAAKTPKAKGTTTKQGVAEEEDAAKAAEDDDWEWPE